METIQENPVEVQKRKLLMAVDLLVNDKELAREIMLQVAEEIREVMMAEERAKVFESYETRDTLPSGVYESVMRPDWETPANDHPTDFTK